MKYEEAYKVLNRVFSKQDLQELCKRNMLDNSETDTIRERLIWSDALGKKALEATDEAERKQIQEAAQFFMELHNTEIFCR